MSRRANYGLDAPGVLVGLTAGGLILLTVSFVNAVLAFGFGAVVGPLIGAAFMFSSAAVSLHTTRRGKFAVWARLLDDLGLAGDEQVLDLGCGRGAGQVAVRPLGWRFWYGGPWMGARLITATRPPAG